MAKPSVSFDAAAATFATASPMGTAAGSAARASAVLTGVSGTTRIASSPSGGSNRVTSVPSQITNPPFSAAATLSGWPSISLASVSTSASSSKMWSAASSPATIAAALDPRPPLSGIAERIVNSNASGGCSASKARTTRLRRSRRIRGRCARRTCPSPPPQPPDAAPAPPPAHRTPAPGSPRTLAREQPCAAGASLCHRLHPPRDTPRHGVTPLRPGQRVRSRRSPPHTGSPSRPGSARCPDP